MNKFLHLLILFLAISFFGCKDPQNKTSKEEPKLEKASIEPYSQKFLDDLKQNPALEGHQLQDNLLILYEDTLGFPDVPEKGRSITLKGEKEGLSLMLTVTRINYTSISYFLSLSEKGKAEKTWEGLADISSGHFMGSEIDESDETGIGYIVTEYSAEEGSCFTSIRLGYEEETSPNMLAKLIKNCNGEYPDLDLDNFPTLKEQ